MSGRGHGAYILATTLDPARELFEVAGVNVEAKDAREPPREVEASGADGLFRPSYKVSDAT